MKERAVGWWQGSSDVPPLWRGIKNITEGCGVCERENRKTRGEKKGSWKRMTNRECLVGWERNRAD